MKIKVLFGIKAMSEPYEVSGAEPLAVDNEHSDKIDLWAEQVKTTGLYERLEIVTVILDGATLDAIMSGRASRLAGQISESRTP